MSPEAERTFELEWAVLARRLRSVLVRKGVDPAVHDDLVQETALRLLSMWDAVDRRRPLWPLTVTIALNLLRDRGRIVNKDDLMGDIPDLGDVQDVEAAGLARVELDRVRRAMTALSPSQRSALMKEIGNHALSNAPDTSSDKMLRMRARRKLRTALENVSGLVALRLRRVVDAVEAAFAAKEGAISAASCVVCLVIGVGATVGAPASLTPHASAGAIDSRSGSALDLPGLGIAEERSATFLAVDEPPRGGDAAAARAEATARTGAARRAGNKEQEAKAGSTTRGGSSGGGAGEDGGLIGVLPQNEDQVAPSPSVGVHVGSGDPAALPGGGDDTSVVPPAPEPPPAPPAPSPPVNTGVPIPPIVEDTDTLL